MNGKKIVVVDYGAGNLFSVKRALEVCGAENILISNQACDINSADKILLPGVGAFEDGIAGLRERGLDIAIINQANKGKPVLGICLGMQLLATGSEENGQHRGLDLIPGVVKKLNQKNVNGENLKIPFVGWAPITTKTAELEVGGPLEGVKGQAVYLVHSYHLIPDDRTHLWATYEYGGWEVAAAVRSKNIMGFQFHPEKSSHIGLSILKKFIETC